MFIRSGMIYHACEQEVVPDPIKSIPWTW
jgi:hypothetical protein